MEYRVFYTCYGTDDSVESNEPFMTDRDTMISMAQQILRSDGDFFGLSDDNHITLQFMMEKGNKIWMEIPAPVDGGSYGKQINASDLEAALLSIDQPFEPDEMAGLTFQKW